LHWYGPKKLTAKSIKPRQKKQNATIYALPAYACTKNVILTKDAHTHNLTIPIQN